MNCTLFRESVHDMDRDDGLDGGAYDAAVAHAQTCTRCARLIYQTRRLDASLRALLRSDQAREASPRVQAQLLRAFRAQAPSMLGARRPLRWLGAAAAVLILAGGGLLVWRRERGPAAVRSVPVRAAANNPSSPPVQSATAAPSQSLASALRPRTQARHTRATKLAAQPDELDDLAEFIPLPYADDDAPLGLGELVRVRLSESALGLLGLPVTDEASAQPVTADVVIGEDGVARAIRFVSGPVPSEFAQLNAATSDNKGVKP